MANLSFTVAGMLQQCRRCGISFPRQTAFTCEQFLMLCRDYADCSLEDTLKFLPRKRKLQYQTFTQV